MNVALYSLVICAVALAAAVRGWRRGFTGQVCSVLGFAFGSVCAHIFAPDVAAFFRHSSEGDPTYVSFKTSFLSSAGVYVGIYALCIIATGIIRKALSVFDAGLLDSLLGALFCMFNWEVFMSILLNLVLCMNPEGELLRCCASGDANAPATVLLLAPAVIGSMDADDLHHLHQLRQARGISQNRRPMVNVIDNRYHFNHDFSSSEMFIYKSNGI